MLKGPGRCQRKAERQEKEGMVPGSWGDRTDSTGQWCGLRNQLEIDRGERRGWEPPWKRQHSCLIAPVVGSSH